MADQINASLLNTSFNEKKFPKPLNSGVWTFELDVNKKILPMAVYI